jgi:putative NIF3 family GTP cyclohydrolase 1 type 2
MACQTPVDSMLYMRCNFANFEKTKTLSTMKFPVIGILLLSIIGGQQLKAQPASTQSPTARQVIAEMQKNLSCQWSKETVDTFKSGNPDDQVTGVATCMFANMETLRKAVASNCNLVIAHEPTFYNHADKTDLLENDPVYKMKNEYIREHGLIIFRFHDHWHMTKPDGIYVGMVNKLGWKANQVDESMKYFKFKEQTVGDFARTLEDQLKGSQVRIVGDPKMKFTNVALSVGAPGSQSHINYLNSQGTELLVAGEGQEWETYQYVLDASMLGMKKAAIFTGHIPSEEAGMEYCAQWMKSFIREIPVVYIENRAA